MSTIYNSSLLLAFLASLCAATLFAAAAWPLSEREKTAIWRQASGSSSAIQSLFWRISRTIPSVILCCTAIVLIGGEL